MVVLWTHGNYWRLTGNSFTRTHQQTGWPRIHYSLTARDRANMQYSAGVMLRMMKETGASVALPIYDSFRTWRRGRDGEAGLDEYLKVSRRAVPHIE